MLFIDNENNNNKILPVPPRAASLTKERFAYTVSDCA